jgi:hypothetical protein
MRTQFTYQTCNCVSQSFFPQSHKLLIALQVSLTQFLCPSNSASACSSTCAYTSCLVKPSANEDASA